MIEITVMVRLPDRADVRRVEDIARLDYIKLIHNGVSYKPVTVDRVLDHYQCQFVIKEKHEGEP